MNYRFSGILPAIVLVVGAASVHAAATFTPLGDLPGGIFTSHALGVSSDGRVVVGRSIDGDGVDEWQAFRWTAETGMVALGHLPGGVYSVAEDASGDGSVIVGTNGAADLSVAFRWTAETGMVALPMPGRSTSAEAVSDDGKVIVGPFFMWTESEGPRELPFNSKAISPDGSVVVGGLFHVSFGVRPVRWTASEGVVPLSNGIEDNFEPIGVSADGSVIVMNSNEGFGRVPAYRWTEATGIVPLGTSWVSSISADGSVIVGVGGYWTEGTGMVSLRDLLIAQGAQNLNNWMLGTPFDISADGLTIVGTGLNPAGNFEGWVARLDARIPEPATSWPLALGIAGHGVRRRKPVNRA